jgi:hypothetical protein
MAQWTWDELRTWGDAHLQPHTPLWVGCLGNGVQQCPGCRTPLGRTPPTAEPLWEARVVRSLGHTSALLQGGPSDKAMEHG